MLRQSFRSLIPAAIVESIKGLAFSGRTWIKASCFAFSFRTPACLYKLTACDLSRVRQTIYTSEAADTSPRRSVFLFQAEEVRDKSTLSVRIYVISKHQAASSKHTRDTGLGNDILSWQYLRFSLSTELTHLQASSLGCHYRQQGPANQPPPLIKSHRRSLHHVPLREDHVSLRALRDAPDRALPLCA